MVRRKKQTIGIVASRYNEEFVNGLVTHAEEILKSGHYRVVIRRVPGAFEIPLGVQQLIKREKPAAVLALGVIWQGKTAHADLLATTVSDALMRLMLEFEVPVIHQVLSVKTEAEAKARCFGKKLNRGREAAEAAVSLLKED